MVSQSVDQRRLRVRAAVFGCISVVALVIDQLTKMLALRLLPEKTVQLIPNLLSLQLYRNPGASLGFGASRTWLITVVAIVLSVAIIVAAFLTTSLSWVICLALAFAGAVGNIIDRVMYATSFLDGKVVDFLNYGWSIGNVADIYLFLAAVGIVFIIFKDIPFKQH
ncbi:MAG: signal peptidase II [Bifidobacteriaceae bacterium]|nr:signal peptidase II [Bifidobacteriaceae bacterium]